MTARLGAAAIGLLLAATPAFAAPSPPAPLWGYIGLATPIETGADAHVFADAKLSVVQVIQTIKQQGLGRVVEIGFAHKDNAGWYVALVATPDGLRHLRIDPVSGAISQGDQPDIRQAAIDPAGRRDLDALDAAHVDLAQAVADAARMSGGQVICAGIEQLGGVPAYYVQTVENGQLSEWSVNPATGRVTTPD
jgi:hypothetical protein